MLAIVLVGEHDEVDGPHYIRNPFDREPAWGVASINYSLNDLLAKRIEMEILSSYERLGSNLENSGGRFDRKPHKKACGGKGNPADASCSAGNDRG